MDGDECRTSADGECGNEHRQSGVANAGGDAYRTKSPDAVAVSVPGKATNATTAIAASCCGELLRRALSRAGRWLVARS